VTAEDLASVLLRFKNGSRGCFSVGQVLPGHKNDLLLEVNGSKLSLKWLQEYQNDLWIGHHRQANEVLAKDPSLILDKARPLRPSARRPSGVVDGRIFQCRRDAYHWIREKGRP
jgi:predicted dehydrogenase